MLEFLKVRPLLVTGKRHLLDFDVRGQLTLVYLSVEFGGEFLHFYVESTPIVIKTVAQIVKSDYHVVFAHRCEPVKDRRILIRVQSDG